ncbi:MAG: hypothetical protein GX887_03690 [Firmicutes bacterium]|nr:hypothetical protein [Bacillota bacterium]
MNISRAKTVLIVVFLGLNIFLAYHLFLPEWGGAGGALTREELQKMEQKLAENNYEISTSIPRKKMSSSFLTVRPLKTDAEKIAKQFFMAGKVNRIIADDKNIFEDDGAVLEIFSNGFYRYLLKKDNTMENNLTGEVTSVDTVEIVEDFMAQRGMEFKELKPDIVRGDPAQYCKMSYYQLYSRVPLFSGHLGFTVEKGIVREVESCLLEIIGQEKRREMEVLPVTMAIMRLIEEIGPAYRKRSITDVSLGFYSQEYDAEQWEVPPVWRIVIDGTDIYYVNAFTGFIEPDGSADNIT